MGEVANKVENYYRGKARETEAYLRRVTGTERKPGAGILGQLPSIDDLPKPPEPPPRPPDATDIAVRAARKDEMLRGRRLGHRTTILTGPQGANGVAPIRRKGLLGY